MRHIYLQHTILFDRLAAGALNVYDSGLTFVLVLYLGRRGFGGGVGQTAFHRLKQSVPVLLIFSHISGIVVVRVQSSVQ